MNLQFSKLKHKHAAEPQIRTTGRRRDSWEGGDTRPSAVLRLSTTSNKSELECLQRHGLVNPSRVKQQAGVRRVSFPPPRRSRRFQAKPRDGLISSARHRPPQSGIYEKKKKNKLSLRLAAVCIRPAPPGRGGGQR